VIEIIDYGLGNTQAFVNIYQRLDIPVGLAKKAEDLSEATHIILPGVGAFDWAMSRLDMSGMLEMLNHLVIDKKIPVLGVCVGMQIMAKSSEEGTSDGLGWIDADVRRFDAEYMQKTISLPHMGWNDVESRDNSDLFNDMGKDARFYFLHSYYFSPNNASNVIASTVYGKQFAAAVRRDNVYGVQFHPEKSHSWGIQLLKNFAGI
jgi:glutamine amidotransferase